MRPYFGRLHDTALKSDLRYHCFGHGSGDDYSGGSTIKNIFNYTNCCPTYSIGQSAVMGGITGLVSGLIGRFFGGGGCCCGGGGMSFFGGGMSMPWMNGGMQMPWLGGGLTMPWLGGGGGVVPAKPAEEKKKEDEIHPDAKSEAHPDAKPEVPKPADGADNETNDGNIAKKDSSNGSPVTSVVTPGSTNGSTGTGTTTQGTKKGGSEETVETRASGDDDKRSVEKDGGSSETALTETNSDTTKNQSELAAKLATIQSLDELKTALDKSNYSELEDTDKQAVQDAVYKLVKDEIDANNLTSLLNDDLINDNDDLKAIVEFKQKMLDNTKFNKDDIKNLSSAVLRGLEKEFNDGSTKAQATNLAKAILEKAPELVVKNGSGKVTGVKATVDYNTLRLTEIAGLDLYAAHNPKSDKNDQKDAYIKGTISSVTQSGNEVNFELKDTGEYEMTAYKDDNNKECIKVTSAKGATISVDGKTISLNDDINAGRVYTITGNKEYAENANENPFLRAKKS